MDWLVIIVLDMCYNCDQRFLFGFCNSLSVIMLHILWGG